MTGNKIANLKRRSELLRAIRSGFYRSFFVEVETPVRIPAPAPEEYIESIRAEGEFLRTSPELAMKVLLADGMERIFQIGSAFRAGEHGWKHREEFTILEYYATGEIFGTPVLEWRDRQLDFSDVSFITVDEAYRRYAGVSAFTSDQDGSFDELMVTCVEPNLGSRGLEFLIDYPASRASLARLAPDRRVAERWELYAAGIELGNAFGELTCAAEQRARFAAALEFRARAGMHPYPEATDFLSALDRGLPESSGCAIGFDRLAMLFCDAQEIGDVRT